jgi:hypothetical protein
MGRAHSAFNVAVASLPAYNFFRQAPRSGAFFGSVSGPSGRVGALKCEGAGQSENMPGARDVTTGLPRGLASQRRGRPRLRGRRGCAPSLEGNVEKALRGCPEQDKSPTIKGVNGPDDGGYRNAIDTNVSRRQPLDALSTHHFSFTETESAIRTLAGEPAASASPAHLIARARRSLSTVPFAPERPPG